MLTVLSQPFFRQRQAVHAVTPTCSSHLDRLTTAPPLFTSAKFAFTLPLYAREESTEGIGTSWWSACPKLLLRFGAWPRKALSGQPQAFTPFLDCARHHTLTRGL